MRRSSSIVLALTGVASLLAGCYSVSYGPAGYERHGVWLPRGAPEPRYRTSKTIVVEGHEAHFDEELRVYRVVDREGYFFSGSRYYRQVDGAWQTARSIEGPWAEIPPTPLPPTLLSLPPNNGTGSDPTPPGEAR